MSAGKWSHAYCAEEGCDFKIQASPKEVYRALSLHRYLTGHKG